MVEMHTVLWVFLWEAVGVFYLLRWQFTQPEVTLLDLIFGIVVGAIFGLVVPLVALLHNVKIKGGQHEI
jgi:multisubunit Na+/H+ antiporter MnhE subunit